MRTTSTLFGPIPPQSIDRLQLETSRIIDIYRLLFPSQRLNFFFYEGDNPIWGEPSIIEGEVTLAPEHLSAEFLGRVECQGAHDAAPVITIMVSVPRAPFPSEMKLQDSDWNPFKPLKALYGITPLFYEEIRYKVEMARKRRARRVHAHTSLPLGKGTSLLPQPQDPNSGKRPAILIGTHWLEVGGAEKLAIDSVRWALEAGLRVFVVAGVASLQRLATMLPDSPDVIFIRLDRYLPDHLWPRFVEQLVLTENIRLLHIHHCRVLYDALPQIRAKTPWVKVIDSTHIIEYADGGYPRISGVWSNYIDIHHVISRELVNYYRDHFQILNKVTLGRMLEGKDMRMSLPPMTMQTAQKTLYVSFIGRLYYQKRPIVLVEILRALASWAQKSNVDLRGTIVGEGPFLSAMKQLMRRYRIDDKFIMKPADCDIPELLSRSDILLVPSNNEGLALVCYEAIEHGCIPISTNVGSQSEVIPTDLLLPLSPRAAVHTSVEIIDKLWRNKDFLAYQKDALHAAWARLAADPTAKDVLMTHYRAAAGTSQE
ncbi:glycosyltransferase [Paracoccus saliphilus]|uniref:Glycosyltransferase n=1 Tax=Paracoccus saliphilus TaxID=405559 RepID=A0AA46A6G0_9RHOB|nr:glycosyltransferase [Paracoccus saliphilus]WCR05482.1 glycosyltransferase [Paracoccus saliphilus]SIS97271.1 Glycosyltransferase involved in cell wall bisynthesis [Paracoccus saliphilus]